MADIVPNRAVTIIELSLSELACRIAEAQLGMVRPQGATPQQALSRFGDDDREGFVRAAEAAAAYFQERFAERTRPS